VKAVSAITVVVEEATMKPIHAVILPALLLVAGLVGCGTQPRAGSIEQESAVAATEQPLQVLPAGTRWRLADSEREGLQGPDASRVILQVEAGRLSGDSGCNQYSADYTIADGRISLQAIAATKRGCPGPRGAIERAWFDALRDLQWISRDGDALRLRLADGATLRFVDAPLETE
jgi:heat shock protein HslJ